jgi:threonine synthase
MRFLSTRARGGAAARSVSFRTALFEGLAPDGGLYMPETIERWPESDLVALPSRSVVETAVAALRPYVGDELPASKLYAVLDDALNFPIPLVEIEPGLFALELFHGPTLAFKDVGARVLARMLPALGAPDAANALTVLVATSGDTGGAVGHACHGVPGVRVVILYPDRRISPTQEAQLTCFNGSPGANVRAYAVDGTFDDCQRLVKTAFADQRLRERAGLTSANSINIGRLLPQMTYYFHAAGLLAARGYERAYFSTPSGNFGNLTAGVMAQRAGAPIAGFVAATNVNDVVPSYLATGVFTPRPSIPTIANAMDCGNPGNFDRLLWLYGDSADAMRADISGSAHTDDEVRGAIRWMDEARGYLLDPHSAIAYLGIAGRERREGQERHDRRKGPGSREDVRRRDRTARVFLATAHPAKFAQVVEPVIGRRLEPPAPLAAALAQPRTVFRIGATPAALAAVLDEP